MVAVDAVVNVMVGDRRGDDVVINVVMMISDLLDWPILRRQLRPGHVERTGKAGAVATMVAAAAIAVMRMRSI